MIANSFISCFIGSLIYLDGDTTCFINFLQSAIVFITIEQPKLIRNIRV